MRKSFQTIMLAIILFLSFGASGMAQAPPKAPEPEKVLVKVEVVLSRYDGTKKVSSLPYTLLATAGGDNLSIRTGSQVAVASSGASVGPDNKPSQWQFLNVGTNIDCTVSAPENGRFKVRLNLSDTSILERQPVQITGARNVVQTIIDVPTLRNFNYTNAILLKDGETKQFVAASDKVSADVVKVDVTLTVEK
jgi:hypothetical protein